MRRLGRALCLVAVLCAGVCASAQAQSISGIQVYQWDSYSHITTATTTNVKGFPGLLHTITINQPVASATITIYDNTAASGTVIGVITLPATLLNNGPITATYDVVFGTGLTIVTTGTSDITVAYR